ncbi:MAG: beta-lactamase family protein [Gemmatimonadaceae bacterium]|nr:beta-lactamase family protein [Gemmatimonadaceae bacterium]MCW5827332.1 beta-lactamase family protein [Gemmatimonadaceae bacterium]
MFEAELRELQTALAVPGIAYVIVSDSGPIASGAFGVAQAADSAPFATSTPLRIASVTKSITAIIALQLVDEGRLDLDAPVREYAQGLSLPDDVSVRHLLSHASEGTIGSEYVYSSSRYAMLGRVIEAVTDTSLDVAMHARVLERAAMRPYPSPDLGAHAALVSTVDDMGRYLTALERGVLLPPQALERLAVPSRTPSGTPLPVSLGWFVQTVQGRPVMWSFGQDDPEHSGALLIRLPEQKLSLFVLANSNVLSDPFRLLMGDATKSPFAMSFLRLFAFSPAGAPQSRPARADSALATALDGHERRSDYRYRDELIGWALVDLWTDDHAGAKRKFDIVRQRYRSNEPDPVLHFASARLQDSSVRRSALLDGALLLRAHPENRWMLLAQGYLLQQEGRVTEASDTFQRILDLPNQEPDFLRRLFRFWSWMAMAQMTAPHDPAQARAYLQNIVQSGVTGEMLADTRRMLDSLDRQRLH